MIYLASPYSHSDPTVRFMRYDAACRAAAILFCEGCMVFSPIAYSHPISVVGNIPGDHATWWQWNRVMMNRCDSLTVLMLDGWKESIGVQAEIEYARELKMEIQYLGPDAAPLSPGPTPGGDSASPLTAAGGPTASS